MDIATIRFVEAELFTVAPLPLTSESFPAGFKVQIYGTEGRKTKFMNITAEQLRKIELVLLGAE